MLRTRRIRNGTKRIYLDLATSVQHSAKVKFNVTVVTSHVEASQEALHLHPSPMDDGYIESNYELSVLETVDTVVVTQID